MSAVVLFIVLTAALTLVVVAVLLRPGRRLPERASERTSESAPAGLEIYRSQWQALARDRAAGRFRPGAGRFAAACIGGNK